MYLGSRRVVSRAFAARIPRQIDHPEPARRNFALTWSTTKFSRGLSQPSSLSGADPTSNLDAHDESSQDLQSARPPIPESSAFSSLSLGYPYLTAEHSGSPDPLPSPPSSTSSPSPLIHDSDIQQYIMPLYLRGWGMSYQEVVRKRLNSEGQRVAKTTYVPSLDKRYVVPDDRSVFEFISEIGDYIVEVQVCNAHQRCRSMVRRLNVLQHHPYFKLGPRSIILTTCTHDAILGPEARLGRASAEMGHIVKRPGVTFRDIRLAYKAEAIFEQLLAKGSHPYTFRMRGRQSRPESVAELLNLLRDKLNRIQRQTPSRKSNASEGNLEVESLVSAYILW
jgi:hypothetical protein